MRSCRPRCLGSGAIVLTHGRGGHGFRRLPDQGVEIFLEAEIFRDHDGALLQGEAAIPAKPPEPLRGHRWPMTNLPIVARNTSSPLMSER